MPKGSISYLPQSDSHRLRGYLFIAGATLFWGISATLGRAVFTGRLIPGEALSPIDPLILAQTRTTIAFLLLAPVLLARRGVKATVITSRRDLLLCLAVGVLGMAAANYFYYLAIERTNVATAIILQYTAPVWVLLYMVARRLQRASAQRVMAVGLAVFGSAMAVGIIGTGEFNADRLGILAALVAALAFAYYNVSGSHLVRRYDRWRVLSHVLLGAALFWIVVNPPWVILRANYSASQWLFMVVFSITSILIPFSLYFGGLQWLDATRAIVTSCLEPVLSIVIAAIFLGELVTWLQVAGMAVVLLATVVVQLPERGKRNPAMHIEPIE